MKMLMHTTMGRIIGEAILETGRLLNLPAPLSKDYPSDLNPSGQPPTAFSRRPCRHSFPVYPYLRGHAPIAAGRLAHTP